MNPLFDVDENMNVVKNILRLLPIALGIVLFRAIGLDELIIFIFAIAYYLGNGIAYLYSKRKAVNERVVSVIAWANLLAWILPLLGMFIAGIGQGLYEQSKLTSNKKYRLLFVIGIILSFMNGTGRIILEKLGL